MSTPKFAETHNLVSFLEKPTTFEGFEKIIDFLNANPIKYALMVNPTIYTSCIKQFWATVKMKTVNREEQIQALVDKKKVIITETSVRSDLHLEDAEGAEGTGCLPTATIFKQLTLIGYENLTQKLTFYKAFFLPQWKFLIYTILQFLSAKTTAWNEFSSTMASATICLATNQKFNFSKYIFDHMVKNLEDGVKFLMFPRFVQVFLDSQVEGMLKHKEIYATPSYTKKIFANIKRQGKDFSVSVTQPSTSSQPQQKHKSKKSKKRITKFPQLSDSTHDVADEHVTTTSNDPLLSGEDRLKLTELIELCTQLQSKVHALESTKANQALEIGSLKRRVKKFKKKASKKTHKLKILYKIGSSTRLESSKGTDMGEDSEIPTNSHHTPSVTQPSTSSQPQQKHKSKKSKKRITKFPQLSDSTHDVADEHVTTTSNDPLLSGEDRLKLTELIELCTQLQSKVHALESTKANQALEIGSLKRRVKKFKKKASKKTHKLKILYKIGSSTRLESSKGTDMFDTSILDDEEVVAEKEVCTADPVPTAGEVVTTAGVEVSIATTTVDVEVKLVKGSEKAAEGNSKRAGGKLEQEEAKRQRIEEENESAELKRCMEIIPDDEDDVTIKATHIYSKYPTIVDYKIYKEGMKSFFKIIRADGNSQNYLTFEQMFKNFNREDLEVLWSIVKARFKKTKLVDDMDNLLF
nr:hypothetical protein [Tanacetum cinerariifolium]